MKKLEYPYKLPNYINIQNIKEEKKILVILHTYGFRWASGTSCTKFSPIETEKEPYILLLNDDFELTYSDIYYFKKIEVRFKNIAIEDILTL